MSSVDKKSVSKNLTSYINEIIDNIRKDRTMTQELIEDAKKTADSLAYVKLAEVLQRSNEQFVKIASVVQKREAAVNEKDFDGDMSKEAEEIYESLE
jgi:hypothetical protein